MASYEVFGAVEAMLCGTVIIIDNVERFRAGERLVYTSIRKSIAKSWGEAEKYPSFTKTYLSLIYTLNLEIWSWM